MDAWYWPIAASLSTPLLMAPITTSDATDEDTLRSVRMNSLASAALRSPVAKGTASKYDASQAKASVRPAPGDSTFQRPHSWAKRAKSRGAPPVGAPSAAAFSTAAAAEHTKCHSSDNASSSASATASGRPTPAGIFETRSSSTWRQVAVRPAQSPEGLPCSGANTSLTKTAALPLGGGLPRSSLGLRHQAAAGRVAQEGVRRRTVFVPDGGRRVVHRVGLQPFALSTMAIALISSARAAEHSVFGL